MTTAPANDARLPSSSATTPRRMPPTRVPISKNIVNELIAAGRSRSSTRFTVRAIRDGYMNAMPMPITAAATYSAHTSANAAMRTRAVARATKAIVTEWRAPSRSGTRAPAMRSTRQTTL